MSTPNTMRCTATTAAGRPCTKDDGLVDGLCLYHDPNRKALLLARLTAAGKRSAVSRRERRAERLAQLASETPTAGTRPAVGNSLADIARWLRWALEAGAAGEIERADLSVFTKTASVLQGVYEKRDLERNLKVALKELATLKRGRK